MIKSKDIVVLNAVYEKYLSIHVTFDEIEIGVIKASPLDSLKTSLYNPLCSTTLENNKHDKKTTCEYSSINP